MKSFLISTQIQFTRPDCTSTYFSTLTDEQVTVLNRIAIIFAWQDIHPWKVLDIDLIPLNIGVP